MSVTVDLTNYNALVNDDGTGNTGTLATKEAILRDAILTPVQAAMTALDSLLCGICQGRLTLTSAVPITTSDVTGATSVYWTPYKGKYVALYDGSSAWALVAFAETTLALGTVTSGLPYDIFAYNNAGTLALEKLAWTNATTRATALALQDGVYVKSGATTRRYLGTIYTTSTTATEDSAVKRFVWNYYNRVRRSLTRLETNASWTYASVGYQQVNASALNQVDIVVGIAEVQLELTAIESGASSTSAYFATAIGEGSTSAAVAGQAVGAGSAVSGTGLGTAIARLSKYPAIGRQFYAWLEAASGGGTLTGRASGTLGISGITGSIEG